MKSSGSTIDASTVNGAMPRRGNSTFQPRWPGSPCTSNLRVLARQVEDEPAALLDHLQLTLVHLQRRDAGSGPDRPDHHGRQDHDRRETDGRGVLDLDRRAHEVGRRDQPDQERDRQQAARGPLGSELVDARHLGRDLVVLGDLVRRGLDLDLGLRRCRDGDGGRLDGPAGRPLRVRGPGWRPAPEPWPRPGRGPRRPCGAGPRGASAPWAGAWAVTGRSVGAGPRGARSVSGGSVFSGASVACTWTARVGLGLDLDRCGHDRRLDDGFVDRLVDWLFDWLFTASTTGSCDRFDDWSTTGSGSARASGAGSASTTTDSRCLLGFGSLGWRLGSDRKENRLGCSSVGSAGSLGSIATGSARSSGSSSASTTTDSATGSGSSTRVRLDGRGRRATGSGSG